MTAEEASALRAFIAKAIEQTVAAANAVPLEPANTSFFIELGKNIAALKELRENLPS